jgi:hypothetical protein
MNNILVIEGATMNDTCFTLDSRITGEEITWNVSKIQRDADAGVFGRPCKVAMKCLPKATAEDDANIDWDKVIELIANGETATGSKALEQPVLAIGSEEGIFCFVDGNHRLAARYKLGLKDFSVYIVPHWCEAAYRVHFSHSIENLIRR